MFAKILFEFLIPFTAVVFFMFKLFKLYFYKRLDKQIDEKLKFDKQLKRYDKKLNSNKD